MILVSIKFNDLQTSRRIVNHIFPVLCFVDEFNGIESPYVNSEANLALTLVIIPSVKQGVFMSNTDHYGGLLNF